MVAYSSGFRSKTDMTEEEARAIAAKTHLFGYIPEVMPYQGAYRLILQGDGWDDTVVDRELARLRAGGQ